MMKKILTLLYLLGSVLVASAQGDDSFNKNSIALGGELTLQGTWQVDVSYHRMFTPYVGVVHRWECGSRFLMMEFPKAMDG